MCVLGVGGGCLQNFSSTINQFAGDKNIKFCTDIYRGKIILEACVQTRLCGTKTLSLFIIYIQSIRVLPNIMCDSVYS